ncbi:MAG: hypothetical protein Kow00107_06040 [Planctomycetota bacterium]
MRSASDSLPETLRLSAALRDASFEYIPHVKLSESSPKAVRLAVNVLVLQADDGLVLFDPGPGDPSCWIDGLDSETRRMNFTMYGGLQRYLSGKGGAESVSRILLTHCHPDHIIALFTSEGRRCKAFPNAVVHVADEVRFRRYSREYLGAPDAYHVLPLPRKRPGFDYQVCNFHARRHTTFKLTCDKGEIVVWGDLLPTAMHLREKNYSLLMGGDRPSFYDAWLENSCRSDSLNLLFHDPRRALCRIGRKDSGYFHIEVDGLPDVYEHHSDDGYDDTSRRRP